MKFSIITPSFNQLPYLKRCVASVADQQGVDVEHIVIDGGSTDGTVQWLNDAASRYRLTFISEPDSGMYDALNKGFDRASGDILAWLNCDEQYLPETLATVAGFFSDRPEVDLLSGDALVVDPDGLLQGFWKCMPLRRLYLENGYLYNLSCAMFFRKRVFRPDFCFDVSFRAVGDQEFVTRLLQKGLVSERMRTYFSVYTFMPENLSGQDFAAVERAILRGRMGSRNRLWRVVLRIMQRSERVLRGCLLQKFPLEYALYVDDIEKRTHVKSGRVSSRWPGMRNSRG